MANIQSGASNLEEMYTVQRQACKREIVDVRGMACVFVKLGMESVRR